MTDRPDGCYRWVMADAASEPEIACWEGVLAVWMLPGDDTAYPSVHKVGVGGTLDGPPDVWVDDLPPAVVSYGTDDPDAR